MVCAHVCNLITVTEIAAGGPLNKRNASLLFHSLYCYQCESDCCYIYPVYIYPQRRQLKRRPEVITTSVYANHCCHINN